MKSLYDYDILVHDVFYRTHHILEYIELHPNMSDLDKKAIKATIMDALVTEKLINPKVELLDFENLAITTNPDKKNYRYESSPIVMGIPYGIKERARKKCVRASGGLPLSFVIAKPTESEQGARYCIYDANTAFSSLFKDPTFFKATYTSPTRHNAKAVDRPFVEVYYNGSLYLVDMLTKRFFRSDYFKSTYKFEATFVKKSKNYNAFDKEFYEEQIEDFVSIATYLNIMELQRKHLENNPKYAELFYEIEKSKENFSEEWALKEEYDNKNKSLLFESKDGVVIVKS